MSKHATKAMAVAAHKAERRARSQAVLDAANMQTSEVVLNGIHLRFAFRGGEGTPLLLCNGIGANLELMLPLIPHLSDRPVVIVDVPGTGRSATGLFWPSAKRYAGMLMDVLDHLEITEPFAVAGISWGGALAQQIARSHPQRVSHLILLATSPGITMLPGHMSALRHMVTPRRYLSRRYLARYAGAIYGGEMRKRGEEVRHHALLMRPPSGSAYVQQLLAMYQFTSLPWLHRIACPALVLSGDDDPIIHPGNARLMARLLPRAQLHILTGAGHLFPIFQAATTARLMEQFLTTS